MAKIAELKKYLTHEFSTGCYTGDDYKSFQTKYLNYLKTLCRKNHWQLVNVGKNHYCFSAFIKSAENKCVYISISDVRENYLSTTTISCGTAIIKECIRHDSAATDTTLKSRPRTSTS